MVRQRQTSNRGLPAHSPREDRKNSEAADAPETPRSARRKVETKFGIVALVGRPNAGKSTLLNRILGQKVSIVSAKPQTTRNRIVGILNEPRGQIAFLDTPGIHKPLHKMNVRMMDHVRASLSEADIVALLVDATEEFGHGDQYVIDLLRQTGGGNRFAILNKIDLLKKQKLLPIIERYSATGLFDEIVPVSASTGDGVDDLLNLVFKNLKPGEALYPTEDFTTQPERFFASEIIREKVLEHTVDELPYTTAVSVDRWEEDEAKNLIKIYATIVVERESQKPIVIGKRAEMVKRIGTEARLELESILGAKVFLDLHVGVHERWREDERFLGELEWPLS
jgi:GTP-binding protein Era